MDADLLLTWMSVTGTGSIRDVRHRVAWLARSTVTIPSPSATGRWMRDLSSLGHAELNWDDDSWAVTRPAIARLPNADATAVLCGFRHPDLLAALEQTDLAVTAVSPEPGTEDLPTPTAILLQYDSSAALRAAAARTGAAYVGCAAARLAPRLPQLALGPAAPPPARGNTTVQRLADTDEIRFEPAGNQLDEGLYRLQLNGRRVHLYLRGSTWHHCSLAEGVFLRLHSRGISAVRWRPEPAQGRQDTGTFFVDYGAPLPPLHARTLTLCSGLPALFSNHARTARYGNVPHTVAARVASSLCQHLTIV